MPFFIKVTFKAPSSKPAAAIDPFGDKAHERAHGERNGTTDLSKGSAVVVHHTYMRVNIFCSV